MTAAEFVNWVLKNAARVNRYESGHDGSDGACDCIGLIIGAWRMSGNSWPWTHGSNYAARYLTFNLMVEQELRLGDLVYKARPPGASGYDLPDRYWDGPDMLDYYHVGVVTSVSPLVITHCSTGGIHRDTVRGKWDYSGQFSKLEYVPADPDPIGEVMTVTCKTGNTVNLRSKPSSSANVIKQVPKGSSVILISKTDDKWDYVKYGATKGYMMGAFLTPIKTAAAIVDQIQMLLDELKFKLGE